MKQPGGGGGNPWAQPGPAGGGLPAQPYTNPGSPYGPSWTGTGIDTTKWTVK